LVIGADHCARCHVGEVQVWSSTPHALTFDRLHRDPRAKEIAQLMGQRSIKRGDLCIDCHYTSQRAADQVRVVAGISCESCHGAARDWLALHYDYGGPAVTRDNESAAHRDERLAASIAAGMRNPTNIYLVAQSCFQCHTVPSESLVNVGGHRAGSDTFEMVAWSQGQVRHNFLRTGGTQNAVNDSARLRVMLVAGVMCDLEFSTRATALATERSTYGLAVAQRAARTALRLYEIQQTLGDPHVQRALEAFAEAELRINNAAQLTAIADRIAAAGIAFAAEANGDALAAVDPWLPAPSTYK
jgi:hypothetical protein